MTEDGTMTLVLYGLTLLIAYEIGSYMGTRDAERMFRERQN